MTQEYKFFDAKQSAPLQPITIKGIKSLVISGVETHYYKNITLGGVRRKERFRYKTPLIHIDIELMLSAQGIAHSILVDNFNQFYFVSSYNLIEKTCLARCCKSSVTEYKLPTVFFDFGSPMPI